MDVKFAVLNGYTTKEVNVQTRNLAPDILVWLPIELTHTFSNEMLLK